jgi:hypothetical protein
MNKGNGERGEPNSALAAEPYGRRRVGVPIAPLTRLERLDAVGVEYLYIFTDPAVKRGVVRARGNSFNAHRYPPT